MNILQEIQDIFRDIFEDENLVVTNETSALDIDDWDSITHVQLLVLIEKKFGVTFTAREIQQFKNVGEIVASIQAKQ